MDGEALVDGHFLEPRGGRLDGASKVTGSPLADCTMRSLSGRICSRTAAALVAGFGMPDGVTRETSAHSLTHHPLPRGQSSARLSRSLVEYTPGVDIWMTNNWKLDANPFPNPFGNAIVVAIRAAGPLKTPLIGPPVPF